MASRMTRAVAKDDTSMYTSLKEVAALFDRAQQQVFKLMAGVRVSSLVSCHQVLTVSRIPSPSSSAPTGISKSPATFSTTSASPPASPPESTEAPVGDTRGGTTDNAIGPSLFLHFSLFFSFSLFSLLFSISSFLPSLSSLLFFSLFSFPFYLFVFLFFFFFPWN